MRWFEREFADYERMMKEETGKSSLDQLNEIGERLSAEYGVQWLPSDFKKKNGYKRSIELSAEYDLYRQDYCGCAFSKAEREAQKQQGMEENPLLLQRQSHFPAENKED